MRIVIGIIVLLSMVSCTQNHKQQDNSKKPIEKNYSAAEVIPDLNAPCLDCGEPQPPGFGAPGLIIFYVNKDDRLLFEKREYDSIKYDLIYRSTKLFYGNHNKSNRHETEYLEDPYDDYNFPYRWKVTHDTVEKEITYYKASVKSCENDTMCAEVLWCHKNRLNYWEKKLKVLNEVGIFYDLCHVHNIILERDEETNDSLYQHIREIIKQAQWDILDTFCLQQFGMHYIELNPPGDTLTQQKNKDKIAISHHLYPPWKLVDPWHRSKNNYRYCPAMREPIIFEEEEEEEEEEE